jgi:serine/threonine protein kinase/WD40 repeat protein/Tfp pilus assembly protein PilF
MNDVSIDPGAPGLDALAEEFVARYRKGERPELSEYIARHPELADGIRDLFPALVIMEDARPADAHGLSSFSGVTGATTGKKLERLGEYRILREVGRGGMGIVYEAEQVSLGRHVALKLFPKHAMMDPRQLERFHREARVAARLHHTNIVPVFGVGEYDGLHYHVMQFIQGLGLDEVLVEVVRLRDVKQSNKEAGSHGSCREAPAAAVRVAEALISGQFRAPVLQPPEEAHSPSTPIDPPVQPFFPVHLEQLPRNENSATASPFGRGSRSEGESVDSSSRIRLPGQVANTTESGVAYWDSVARIGVQVADALAYANSQGVLHRDIKPSNLLLDTAGTVWVTDFGLAKASGSDDLTHAGDVVGTLRYMPPERFAGRSDQRSDIYSLGVTLYELLTLRAPFTESDRHKLVRQISQEEPPRPRSLDRALPRDLETIVLKAIAKQPADRYQTAESLAADLRRFLEDKPIQARRIGRAERLWRWCRRNPVVAGLAATVVVLAAVLGVGAPVTQVVRLQRDHAVIHLNRVVEAEREARHNQERAERAELEVKIRSHLVHATAHRRSGRIGQRFQCLEELIAAVRLDPSPELRRELRDEAIAAVGLTDLRVLLDRPVGLLTGPQCDFQLQRYAFVDYYKTGEAVVRRLDDNREVLRVPRPGFSFWHAATDFTPDGQYLLVTYFPRNVASGNAVLQVWHVERREQVLEQETQSGDVIGAVAAHGPHLLFVNRKLELCVWDLAAGREHTRLPLGMTPYSICVDAAGRRAAVNDYFTPLVRILDLETGRELASWSTDVGTYAMAWSADGQLLASAQSVGRIFVRRVPQGELVSILDGQVIRAEFAHRGHLLATSGWDGTTQLWDAVTGTQLVQAVGEMVRFSEDDQRLAFFHGKGIGIWEVAHGLESRAIQPMWLPHKRHYMSNASFSPDGRLLAVSGRFGVWLWDRATGEQLAHLALSDTRPLLFRADGSGLVTCSAIDGLTYWPMRWELHGGPQVLRIGPPRLLQALGSTEFAFLAASWLPDERAVAVADNANRRVLIVPLDKDGTESEQIALSSQHGRITSVAVSADGRWVAAGGWKEPGIQVWNLPERRLECVLPHSDSPVATVFFASFSPDGRWLVSAAKSDDSSSYLAYRVGSWERETTRSAEFGTVVASTFSADGRLMALSISPSQILLADAASGREIKRLTSGQQHAFPAAFSDDGSELIIHSGYHSTVWWNLDRIDKRLRELGLAWNSADDTANESRKSRPELHNASTSMDRWSDTGGSASRLTVQVDQGDLVQRIAAHEKARIVAEQLRLAHGLIQAQVWEQARAAMERALAANRDDARVQNNLAWLLAVCPDLQLRDSARSLVLASKAVELQPNNATYRNTLGVAHYRAGEWRAAIDTLTKAEELRPGTYFGHNAFFLAMAHWQQGDRETARNWFDRAVEWLEKNPVDEELRRFRIEAESFSDQNGARMSGRPANEGAGPRSDSR